MIGQRRADRKDSAERFSVPIRYPLYAKKERYTLHANLIRKGFMLIFKILLIAVETICSFLIIGVILLQKSKGEGLGMAFGAEMGESIFGARASNVLVKITIWLGTIFILNTVILAMIYTNASPHSILGGRPRAPVEQSAPASPGPSLPAMPTMPAPVSPLPQSPQETTPQTPAAP